MKFRTFSDANSNVQKAPRPLIQTFLSICL